MTFILITYSDPGRFRTRILDLFRLLCLEAGRIEFRLFLWKTPLERIEVFGKFFICLFVCTAIPRFRPQRGQTEIPVPSTRTRLFSVQMVENHKEPEDIFREGRYYFVGIQAIEQEINMNNPKILSMEALPKNELNRPSDSQRRRDLNSLNRPSSIDWSKRDKVRNLSRREHQFLRRITLRITQSIKGIEVSEVLKRMKDNLFFHWIFSRNLSQNSGDPRVLSLGPAGQKGPDDGIVANPERRSNFPLWT